MSSRLAALRPVALGAALLIGAWAAGVALTGGGVVDLGAFRLSSRAPLRPALAAVALFAVAVVTASAEERRRGLARARTLADRAAPGIAGALAAATLVTAAVFNEHAATGADASGYLSQSRLWAEGRASIAVAPIVPGPWPDRGWLQSPLGYAPAAAPDRLGPTYAPGLPWLMALGAALAGETGRFIWTPLAAGLVVWLTFVTGRRLGLPPAVALGGAVLAATSPPLLFNATQTMSDLVCAALWTAALVATTGTGRHAAPVTAMAAALALVVRPNLVPVAALFWTAVVAVTPGPRRARLERAAVLGAGLAVAAAAIAVLNQHLWGSPLSSGYGAPADLFDTANVGANAARLWRWTGETAGWWSVAGLAALAWAWTSGRRAVAAPGLALAAGLAVAYLPYARFEEWWYLRFYLPAWPVVAAAAAGGAWALLRHASADAAPLVVLVAALAAGATGLRVAAEAGVFRLWEGAQRYPAVAAFVREAAPPGALVLAVQHSGALHYDAPAVVVRWDYLPPDRLDAFVADALARRRAVWLVADDLEEAPFRTRFSASPLGALQWAPLAEARVGPSRTRIYDLTTPTRAVAPALIRVVDGGPWPWSRRPPAAK